ncbi:MAG: nucleotidyltransferase family protein [Nanoarchaeota archaeon]
MKNLSKEKILEELHKNKDKIRNFGVKNLILFGSFARDEQKETSDIDFLVEFEDRRGLFDDKVGLLLLFEDLFGREIDIVKPNLIREELKEEILGGVQYAAKI